MSITKEEVQKHSKLNKHDQMYINHSFDYIKEYFKIILDDFHFMDALYDRLIINGVKMSFSTMPKKNGPTYKMAMHYSLRIKL